MTILEQREQMEFDRAYCFVRVKDHFHFSPHNPFIQTNHYHLQIEAGLPAQNRERCDEIIRQMVIAGEYDHGLIYVNDDNTIVTIIREFSEYMSDESENHTTHLLYSALGFKEVISI